jgi:hypothetical protein
MPTAIPNRVTNHGGNVKQDMIQAYKDYANNLRLGDHSLARLAAREYNELLAELGGRTVPSCMGPNSRCIEPVSI